MTLPLPDGDADADDAGSVLSAEVGALAARVRFDLALVARLDGDRLELLAGFGPLIRGLAEDRAAPVAACAAEGEALRSGAAVAAGPLGAGVDPLSGLDLPGDRWGLVVPLSVGRRALGVLSLARAGGPAFDAGAIAAAQVHARALSLALLALGQSAEIERLRSHGDERISLLETELRGPSNEVIEASRSAAMREVAWRARQVAPTDTPVLILGETGVGKEWLAHAIHSWSARAARPFVKMNCAAIASGTLDSELFGHAKGAFTGATRARPGRFQIADGGTLLLDEVGELPLEVQAKLLRVLQDGTFFPVGSDRLVRVDVRILAATLVDLERAIAARTFRDDLYYRLAVFPLRVPPLRRRIEDLPMLCDVLLAQQAARTGRRRVRVSPEGLAKLATYAWPGNLRELGNVLERATILSRGGDELAPEVLDLPGRASQAAVTPARPQPAVTHAAGAAAIQPAATGAGGGTAPLPGGPSAAAQVQGNAAVQPPEPQPRGDAAVQPPATGPLDAGMPATLTLDEVQRLHIERALQLTHGKVYGEDGAARLLGMKPSTLQSRMRKLGVRRPGG